MTRFKLVLILFGVFLLTGACSLPPGLSFGSKSIAVVLPELPSQTSLPYPNQAIAIVPGPSVLPTHPLATPNQPGGADRPSATTADRNVAAIANLGLEVSDTDNAIDQVSDIVAQAHGYLVNGNLTRDAKGCMSGTLTVRVPADHLDQVQAQVEKLGKVLSRSQNANDVTDSYADHHARLTNREAAEVKLRTLLATVRERTGRADDIFAIYARLTDIRGQIDQTQAQINSLSQSRDFATLTIDLRPHEVVILEPEGWGPEPTVRATLRALIQTLQRLATMAIGVGLFIVPLGLLMLIPFLALVAVVRFARRTRPTPPTPRA